jgi:RHS repeat-associated protein
LAQGQPILAIHIQELRERIKTALGSSALTQYYDGDRLRGKKSEYGATTYYVRSSVLGGQVIAELNGSGGWSRGYVCLGGQMVAIQNGAVNWVHQDPVTKSQRITNSSGAVVSTIDLDPWGGETNRSGNSAFQPHKYTTYERDANGGDDAMHRRYQSNWTRFSQPDPYDGSYDATNPQSFNRYSYVQNDPVNFVDPTGLNEAEPGSACSTNGHHNDGIIGMDGKCYAGPGASVTVGGGGPSSDILAFLWRSYLLSLNPGGRGPGGDPGGGGGGQNPAHGKDDDVFTRIAPNLKPVAKALGEYQDCVKKNPRAQEYRDKLNVAGVRASIPKPSLTTAATVGYNSTRAYRTGQAILTLENVYKPAIQGAVFSLFLNSFFFSADADLLRKELLKPWEDGCKKQIQEKYGFRP